MKQKENLNENIDYIIKQIEINLNNINVLEKNILKSKNQIVNCFKKMLITVKKWQEYINNNNTYSIRKEYQNIESEISELE